jgi:ankyrin repeat protein
MTKTEEFKRAFNQEGAAGIAKLFESNPECRALINEPLFSFDSPAIVRAASMGNRELIDVLLDAGADINVKSKFWAGGFGVLDMDHHELAEYLISRGAIVDAYAAARHGKLDKLRELVAADPACVHKRGGDGQTPLHVARNVETAEFLLEHGAEIDALDVDHESTPAQYMLDHRQDVARYLVRRGCRTDILMAATLGDRELVLKHIDQIEMRVNNNYFRMKNPHAGGTIYIWTIGSGHTAHQIAWKRGDSDMLALLMEHSPESLQKRVVADRVVFAARDNNTAAVRQLLESGCPVDGSDEITPLHWAAWHGNAEMTAIILQYHPPLEKPECEYHAPPLGWATHGSLNGWHCRTGNYPAVVEALIQAGAKLPEKDDGTEAVRAVLRRYR